METVKQFVISITAAAAVCSIVLILVPPKGSTGQLIRMVAGLFMAITALKPILSFSISGLEDFALQIGREGDEAVSYGESVTRAKMEEAVTERMRQLILDRAESMGASLQISLILNDMVPERVIINGPVSPYAKGELSAWIEANLGISGEAQEWNG